MTFFLRMTPPLLTSSLLVLCLVASASAQGISTIIFAIIILIIMHGLYRAEKIVISCPKIRLQSIVVTTG